MGKPQAQRPQRRAPRLPRATASQSARIAHAQVQGVDNAASLRRSRGGGYDTRLSLVQAASIGNTKPLFTRVFSSHFSVRLLHHPRAPTPCPPPVLPLAPALGLGLHAQRRTPWRGPRPGAPWARRVTGSPPPAAPERQQRASRPVACCRASCWLRVTGSRPPHAGGAAARDCFKRMANALLDILCHPYRRGFSMRCKGTTEGTGRAGKDK